MEVGEDWVYRPKARTLGAPSFHVRIDKIKQAKVPKFQVQLLDGEEAGLRVWVSKGTLMVPWADREAWLADDSHYAAALEASTVSDEAPEYRAMTRLIDEIWNQFDVLRMGWNRNDSGLLLVGDLAAAKESFGEDLEELIADPLTFTDRFGVTVAPWPAALRWAQRACEVLSDTVMRWVDREERDLRDGVVHGRVYRFSRGEPYEIPPERCAETFDEDYAVLEVLRKWCGAEPLDRFDELKALRDEVVRLNTVVESALASLRRAGLVKEAEALHRQFGYRPGEAPRPRHGQ